MRRFAVPARIVAVVVFALAIVAVVLGLNLLPTRMEAIEKGTYAPWVIVWIMIGVTDACAVALAGFLFSFGLKALSGTGNQARV